MRRLRHHRELLARPLRKLRRFFRSPKGYLAIALVTLAAVAAPFDGWKATLTMLTGACAGAVGMELTLVRIGIGRWKPPTSAILTGLIVGMIVGPHERWYVPAVASVLAIAAKHLLRLGRVHIFNPAALGLVAVFFIFQTEQSWWGALPSAPWPLISALLVGGVVVAERAKKLAATLAFLTAYVALFTLASFVGDPTDVSEIFQPPFVNAALFFAFFMVTDPPTSPVAFRAQVWFGVLVAAVSVMIYLVTKSLAFLPFGLLASNVAYAAWREISLPAHNGNIASRLRRPVATR